MALRSDVATLRAAAIPLRGSADDYAALFDRIADANVVLLGEATHGTHEFYRERARITKRLIREKGFNLVAIEGDWPDAYRVHRYVTGRSHTEGDANDALAGFRRFPTWMWRNADMLDFVGFLRAYNEGLGTSLGVGVYGLDLYSLYSSIEAVIEYLERVEPSAAARARERYACFDHFGEDSQSYGYITGLGLRESCADEVREQLFDMQRRAFDWLKQDGQDAHEELFYVEQNARLVANAEEYYRSMFQGSVATWNLRDRHMGETLKAIIEHRKRFSGTAKVVVWAHNSHIGDARATEMGKAGELNIGQIAREEFGANAVLVGFSTYEGTVTAASDWDGPAERKRVLRGLFGSYEALLHDVGFERMLLDLRDERVREALSEPRLERAIGVVYRPDTERASHYFRANMAEQFDIVIHVDRTRAVEPLERSAHWEHADAPETYPFAV